MARLYLSVFCMFFLAISFAQKPVKKTTATPKKESDELPSLNFGIENQLKEIARLTRVTTYPVIKENIVLTQEQKTRLKKIDAQTHNVRECLTQRKTNCDLPYTSSDPEYFYDTLSRAQLDFIPITQKAILINLKTVGDKTGLTGFEISFMYDSTSVDWHVLLQKEQPLFILEVHFMHMFPEAFFKCFYYFDEAELFYEENLGKERLTPGKTFNELKNNFKNLPLLIKQVKEVYNKNKTASNG